jgi:hypothetical protein
MRLADRGENGTVITGAALEEASTASSAGRAEEPHHQRA